MSIATRPKSCAEQENSIYMSPRGTNYSRADLVSGLRLTGLGLGDVVFFQVSHHTLGTAECGSSEREVWDLLYSAMREGDRA